MTCDGGLRTGIRESQVRWIAIALFAVVSCDNDRPAPKVEASRPVVTEDPENPCDDKDDGEECGKDHHCIDGECLINICGDGFVAGMEQCDDGNQAIGDDCTPSCRLPAGTCGDGKVDQGEECDDGNSDNSDFCSNVCLRQLCRNGVLDVNEECDDGNTDPTDGCNNACHKVVCGDGKAEEQEECDDGNWSETDSCSNACTAIKCGNDRIDVGEACDKSRVRSASGKPEGDPLPEGASCAADCKSVSTMDPCKECAKARCRDYTQMFGEGPLAVTVPLGDVFAGCFQQGFTDPMFEGRPATDASWVKRCTALADCARRNRCDLLAPWSPDQPTYNITSGMKAGQLLGCFCGEAEPGSGTWKNFDVGTCYTAPAGKCVQQVYDATECADAYCVEGFINSETMPAFYASHLSECQQQYCFKECL